MASWPGDAKDSTRPDRRGTRRAGHISDLERGRIPSEHLGIMGILGTRVIRRVLGSKTRGGKILKYWRIGYPICPCFPSGGDAPHRVDQGWPAPSPSFSRAADLGIGVRVTPPSASLREKIGGDTGCRVPRQAGRPANSLTVSAICPTSTAHAVEQEIISDRERAERAVPGAAQSAHPRHHTPRRRRADQ